MRKLLRLAGAGTAVVLAVSVLLPTPLAAAGDREKEIEAAKRVLRAKIREADAQAASLAQKIRGSDRRRAALEAEIAELNQMLEEAETRLGAAEISLEAARGELFTLEARLATTIGLVDDAKEGLDDRVRDAYKRGPLPYLHLVVSARSLREFGTRVAYVRTVLAEDQERIRRLEGLARSLDRARSEAVQRKFDIESQKALIETEKVTIAELQSEVADKRRQVVEEIATGKSLLARVQADKQAYLRQMAQLEAESKRIRDLLRSRQRGQTYQAGSGKSLAWPTTGRVTSGFGYRTHPIYGDRRFHAGIDIGAPSGQTVIAAEAGSVVFSGTKGGYGLVVVIDHGGTLATVYAHLSASAVGSGARVFRGTRVGSVGCTGYCTGPHLHFETRINGDPVDPIRYF